MSLNARRTLRSSSGVPRVLVNTSPESFHRPPAANRSSSCLVRWPFSTLAAIFGNAIALRLRSLFGSTNCSYPSIRWCAATIRSAARVASFRNATAEQDRSVCVLNGQRRSADRRGGAQRHSGTLVADTHPELTRADGRATYHSRRFVDQPPPRRASCGVL